MQRSTLSTVIRFAAGGFALAASVMLSPVLQADGDAKTVGPLTHVATPSFEATVRLDEKTRQPMLEVVNLTDQPTQADWKLRVMSAGEAKLGLRVLPQPKETYSHSGSAELSAKQTVVVPLDVPPVNGKESRTVFVDVGGASLVVNGGVPMVFNLAK